MFYLVSEAFFKNLCFVIDILDWFWKTRLLGQYPWKGFAMRRLYKDFKNLFFNSMIIAVYTSAIS